MEFNSKNKISGNFSTSAGVDDAFVIFSNWDGVSNKTVTIELEIVGISVGSGQINTYTRKNVFKWVAGDAGPLAVGALIPDTVLEENVGWDAVIALNGNDIEVQFTADASEGIEWSWEGSVSIDEQWALLAVWSTNDTTQSHTVRLTAGALLSVDWGDGSRDVVTGTGGDQAVTHNYAGAGTYSQVWRVRTPSALERHLHSNNALYGSVPTSGAFTSVVYAYYNSNYLSGAVEPGTSPSLGYLDVFFNASITSLGSLSGLTALVRLRAYSCSISAYTSGTIAATCTTFDLSNNALSTAAVDAILADFTAGAAGRPASGTINLSGGTNAAPTPAVLAAAQAALPGWTITTN